MRILCCGDREWKDKKKIRRVLQSIKLCLLVLYDKDISCIIEGECKGADLLSRSAGEELGIEIISFPANWNKFGNAAGPIRNTQMLKEGKPDFVIAFHSNISSSKGTRNMLNQAESKGIPTLLIT